MYPEIDEDWVKPLLTLRGLKSFKLDVRVEDANAAFLERLESLEREIQAKIYSADHVMKRDQEGVNREAIAIVQ